MGAIHCGPGKSSSTDSRASGAVSRESALGLARGVRPSPAHRAGGHWQRSKVRLRRPGSQRMDPKACMAKPSGRRRSRDLMENQFGKFCPAPAARGRASASPHDGRGNARRRNLESRAKIVARWIRSLSLNPLPMGEGKKASRHVMQGSLFREWGEERIAQVLRRSPLWERDIGGSLRLTGRIAYSRASDPILLLGCCQGFYAADSG